MKLKNFLLGASLAVCGAAFGQDSYKIYVPSANITLYASTLGAVTNSDGNTTISVNVTSTAPGNPGGLNPGNSKAYLGAASGYSGTWGPNSTIICNSQHNIQCIFY